MFLSNSSASCKRAQARESRPCQKSMLAVAEVSDARIVLKVGLELEVGESELERSWPTFASKGEVLGAAKR